MLLLTKPEGPKSKVEPRKYGPANKQIRKAKLRNSSGPSNSFLKHILPFVKFYIPHFVKLKQETAIVYLLNIIDAL